MMDAWRSMRVRDSLWSPLLRTLRRSGDLPFLQWTQGSFPGFLAPCDRRCAQRAETSQILRTNVLLPSKRLCSPSVAWMSCFPHRILMFAMHHTGRSGRTI